MFDSKLYLVLFLLGKKNKLKKGDMFIVSLAIADLIACFIWPLHMITYHSYIYTNWFFSSQSAFYFIFYTTLMVSSWQLLLIAIDRYWCVTSFISFMKVPSRGRGSGGVRSPGTWL